MNQEQKREKLLEKLWEINYEQIRGLGKTLLLVLFADIGFIITKTNNPGFLSDVLVLWLPCLSFVIYSINIYFISRPHIEKVLNLISKQTYENHKGLIIRIDNIIECLNFLYGLSVLTGATYCYYAFKYQMRCCCINTLILVFNIGFTFVFLKKCLDAYKLINNYQSSNLAESS